MKNQNSALILTNFLKSKTLLYFVLFLFLLKISASFIFINFPSNIFFADITKSNLVNMLNQTRQSLGFGVLIENSQLNQAAQLKAEDMIKNGYFSHVSPMGITPWHWFYEAGYSYEYAGENLAIGFYDSNEVFNAWMNSSSHKENMINSMYSEVGTAVLEGFGENNAIVVVQLFGTQKTKASVVSTEKSENTILEEAKAAPETEIDSEPSGEKVLSYSTSIEAYKNNAFNNFYLRFLNFLIYSNNSVLQYLIYGTLIIILGILMYILYFNYNNQNTQDMIFRSIILMAILSFSALINRDLIISIIPHQIII